MQKRQIFKNAGMSVTQIIVNGGILFVLYRFLLNSLGPEELGIWSLVLATTSVMNVANFGLSGSVVKFVAKYLGRNQKDNVSKVIHTASISVGLFIGLALLIAYPIISWILGLVVTSEHLHSALTILPYSLLSLWIMSMTGIFQSGLDGHQRIDLRNYLSMAGASLYLILSLIFVPYYGLEGVAYSQVTQSILIFISSWMLLKRLLPDLGIIPAKWDKNIFKEIITYGVNFQIISITTMFYDPITKALLSRFGGLSSVAYYEMANKMIQQFRALIVSANRVLVPTIADLQERTPEKIIDVYLTSYQLLFYLALPLYSLIIVSLPIISEIWIGHYERVFIAFAILLAIGAFLNTLAGPAYFSYLGTGELKWNVLSHISIGILNAGLGFVLGILFGGTGVVIAWVSALSLGSSAIYLSYHIKNKISLSELMPQASRKLLFICFSGVLLAILFSHNLNQGIKTIPLNSSIILLFCLIIFIPLWLHPMRKRLMGWINNELLNRKYAEVKR